MIKCRVIKLSVYFCSLVLCTLHVVLRSSCSPFPPFCQSIHPSIHIHPIPSLVARSSAEPTLSAEKTRPPNPYPSLPPSLSPPSKVGEEEKTHPPSWPVVGPLSHAHANAHAHAHACASGSTDVKEPGQAESESESESERDEQSTSTPHHTTLPHDATRHDLQSLGVLSVSFRALMSRLAHERALLPRATAVDERIHSLPQMHPQG